jgi:hypothetical protein
MKEYSFTCILFIPCKGPPSFIKEGGEDDILLYTANMYKEITKLGLNASENSLFPCPYGLESWR